MRKSLFLAIAVASAWHHPSLWPQQEKGAGVLFH